MEDILSKIRWNIDFIKEETEKVPGSYKTKKEILDNCKVFSDALSECCNADIDKEKAREIMKPALDEFDKIIEIIQDKEDEVFLFMLLINYIADIKFLLLNKKK